MIDELLAEVKQPLEKWAVLGSHFIGACFDQAQPFLDRDYSGLDPLVRFVSAQLYIDCHLTSESVLLLIREGKEWDADILVRPVIEGSLKHIYMLLGNSEEVQQKVEEYWEILPMFSGIRRSERLKRFLAVADPADIAWQPFRKLILDDITVQAVREKYSKAQRKQLEEKWSFAGIVRAFIESGDPELKLVEQLEHGYGMSSHLMHKDGDGVAIVWERMTREPSEQVTVKMAHSARVVLDVCSFAWLRLLYLLKACEAPTNCVYEIHEGFQDFMKELSDNTLRQVLLYP